MPDNPFLDSTFQISWSRLTPEHVVPAIEEALAEAQRRIDGIAATPLERLTFENTFLALEQATEDLTQAWGKVGHLQSVADTPPLRDAHNAVLPKVSTFLASIPLNPLLWERLKRFAEGPEAAGLQGVSRRFIEETLAHFRQQGADVSAEQRRRLEELQSELAQVTQKYSENVLDATNAWELLIEDPARLAGIPAHAQAAARRSAKAKGLGSAERPVWRFTLHMPSLEPLLTYADDVELRREAWEASAAVGACEPFNNTPLIPRILALRAEKAAILGKPNFADLILERRMAKSGERALAFVQDLERRARPAFEVECRELEQFRAEQTGSPARPLAPWELAYMAERLRKARHAFNEEALRPYFPMDRVLSGLFEIAKRVFAIRIQAREPGTVETWDPNVRYYDVYDREGRHLGSFYADWFPRESKRGGAWMNYLITGTMGTDGRRSPHLGLICGNLTPPDDGRPALLSLREVETVFHEFGHLLHHLLGEVEVKSLNGVNVAWDFVELPSQIMENWCWQRESLDLFARHHETAEPIPDTLFAGMVSAKNFRSACVMMRQLAFAKLDLLLHMRSPEFVGSGDVEPAARALVADCLIATEPPAPTVLKRFGHVFSDPVGYAAGYYSYKWAEVLDADAFTRFQDEGIFSEKVGAEFVEHILSKGNSRDPAELYRAFMGREPDLGALLRRCGLIAA